MMRISTLLVTALLIGTSSFAYGDSVELRGVMNFPPLVPFGREWRASLDCRAIERGIRMHHTSEMESEIRSSLKEIRRISKDGNHYSTYVYLNDFSCAHDGLDSKTVFPLNIVNVTDNSSAVVANVTVEIYNDGTGELVDSAAIQVKGIITEWHGFFLPVVTTYYYQDVTEDAVWRDVLKEIVKTVETRVLGNSKVESQ